jgi:hypothetical protein
MIPYEDPVITKYFDLVKSKTQVFKRFFQGDPIRVPASMLPCCIISKSETRAGNLSNAEDEHGMQMILTVITDIRHEIRDEKDIAPGIAQLYDIIEGRDATTLTLKTQSLLHILRNNVLVDATTGLRTDLATITRVDYGMTVGKREPEAWSVEAQVEFVAHFTQVR